MYVYMRNKHLKAEAISWQPQE